MVAASPNANKATAFAWVPEIGLLPEIGLEEFRDACCLRFDR
jgi:hypothetical protein